MKRFNLVLLFVFSIALVNAQKIMGFTDAHATKQADWEKYREMNCRMNG